MTDDNFIQLDRRFREIIDFHDTKEQVAKLKNSGIFSFFIRLDRLINEALQKIISSKEYSDLSRCRGTNKVHCKTFSA